MKKLLIALAAVLVTVSSYGQGQVLLSNLGGGVNAPVYVGDAASGKGPGPDYSAQLFLVGANNATTALTPATTFRPAGTTPQTAIADRYLDTKTVDVPGITPGSPGTFLVRAWKTSLGSFDAAKATGFEFGESGPVTVNVGGGTLPAANLTGLQSFSIAIPEPSILALGVLGASALLLRRRK